MNEVAFSPDSTTLAIASDDHTVRLWDARTGRPIATLTGHTDIVWAVAFSPDSATLATTSTDGTVRLWDARTGRPITTFTNGGEIALVAFSPDGAIVATANAYGTARLWSATVPSPHTQIEKICNTIGRNLTREEWSQYLLGQPYEPFCRK